MDSLVAEAKEIDDNYKKDLSKDNDSLLTSARKFAAKMEENLRKFKQTFLTALQNKFEDIANNPVKYPATYNKLENTRKLVAYALIRRKAQ